MHIVGLGRLQNHHIHTTHHHHHTKHKSTKSQQNNATPRARMRQKQHLNASHSYHTPYLMYVFCSCMLCLRCCCSYGVLLPCYRTYDYPSVLHSHAHVFARTRGVLSPAVSSPISSHHRDVYAHVHAVQATAWNMHINTNTKSNIPTNNKHIHAYQHHGAIQPTAITQGPRVSNKVSPEAEPFPITSIQAQNIQTATETHVDVHVSTHPLDACLMHSEGNQIFLQYAKSAFAAGNNKQTNKHRENINTGSLSHSHA